MGNVDCEAVCFESSGEGLVVCRGMPGAVNENDCGER
jgi:hypothetical protein